MKRDTRKKRKTKNPTRSRKTETTPDLRCPYGVPAPFFYSGLRPIDSVPCRYGCASRSCAGARKRETIRTHLWHSLGLRQPPSLWREDQDPACRSEEGALGAILRPPRRVCPTSTRGPS